MRTGLSDEFRPRSTRHDLGSARAGMRGWQPPRTEPVTGRLRLLFPRPPARRASTHGTGCPTGWTSAHAIRATKPQIVAAAHRRTIAWSSPAPTQPGCRR
jgi:hypothetical protein